MWFKVILIFIMLFFCVCDDVQCYNFIILLINIK